MTFHALCPQMLPNYNQRPPAKGEPSPAPGWWQEEADSVQGALPPGAYIPFLAYLPQSPFHQQPLGHQKLQMTCQAECQCVCIVMRLGHAAKRLCKAGTQATRWFSQGINTAQGFAPNDEPSERARGWLVT